MKHAFFFLSFFLIFSASLQAQKGSMDGFFEKYQDDEAFTIVNISPKMFSVISGMDSDQIDPELKEILNNIQGMKILTRGSDGKTYIAEAMTVIEKNGLEELMTIKEEGENVKIFGKSNDAVHLSEVVMLTDNKAGFVLMQVIGELRLDQLSRLSDTFNK